MVTYISRKEDYMFDKMCIKIENNIIEPYLKNSYLKLLLDLNDGICMILSNNFKNIDTIIDEVLLELTDREEKLLRLYYGLDTEKPLDFDEIGKIFNLSRTTIKQIYSKAIRKMKHPSRMNQILKNTKYKIHCLENKNTTYKSYNNCLNTILENDIKLFNESKISDTFILNKVLKNRKTNLTIDDLNFNIRIKRSLKRSGFIYLKDLLNLTDEDYDSITNLEKSSKEEIKEKINYFMSDNFNVYNIKKSFFNINNFKTDSLFCFNLSLSLIRELTYMGYININDVVDNFNNVLLTLESKTNLYDELIILREKFFSFTLIFNATLDLFSFISKNNIKTYDDLINNISKARKKSLQKNILTIQHIKNDIYYDKFKIIFEDNDTTLDKSNNDEQEIITNELDDDLLDSDIILDFNS